MDRSIFRAYDIRGLVGSQLTPDTMYMLGRALACTLKTLDRSQVFLGRDGRHSSEALAIAIRTGLCDGGCHVLDIGVVTTPMLYFATHHTKTDSGVMVTGSHNPATYNGVKLVLAGQSCVQAQMDQLYEQVVALQAHLSAATKGTWTSQEIQTAYVQRVTEAIHLERPFKVVVDAGNGVAGPVSVEVLKKIGCEVIPLYCDIQGSFPHHHPDPTVESNLVDLRQKILETQADLGFGFDGDGDRLGVLTNTGEVIWPDRLMMFYIPDILKRHPKATIVFDVKCSKMLQEQIESLGGKAFMCPTGHSIVKKVMKETNAPLAGEMSGHLFFKDKWYGFDDALYSACRLLELLSYTQETVHTQFLKLPKRVSTPELKIPIEEEEKFALIQRFSETAHFEDAIHITIDGLRVEFTNGWGLLRASNTTPCLIARFEADSEDALQQIQALFKTALLGLSQELQLPF